MKKQMKKQLMKLLDLLEEAHKIIAESIEKDNRAAAKAYLEECQNTAIAVGTKIDETEGTGTASVARLENYCDLVYTIYEQILGGNLLKPSETYNKLDKSYHSIVHRMEQELPEIMEVVFLPYKASMWDSLESVWEKANADPCIEAKVIPIPYYDKNPDGSFGKLHYEGEEFSPYVPIIHYDSYDFEKSHPDEIYIHNPYDNWNVVTSVHPFFYSKNLKKYTDKLVYIPYFILKEIDIKNKNKVMEKSHYVQLPAVIYADEIIVQSENMRRFYIECMVMVAGETVRKAYEQKIKGIGSPKIEKIRKMNDEGIEIPEEWKPYFFQPDGRKKKVVLYNTSISAFLKESDRMLHKMEQVFEIFKRQKDEIALLWRPHPLMEATVCSTRPQLYEQYLEIVEKYKREGFGIYDDSSDMDRALVLADAYYGDQSSLVILCNAIHKPIMIQNVSVANI